MAITNHWPPAGVVWTPLTPGTLNGLLMILTATTKVSPSTVPTTARTALVPLLVVHLVTPLGLLLGPSGLPAPPLIEAAEFPRPFLTPSKLSNGWWIPMATHPPCLMSPMFARTLGESPMSTAFPLVTTSFGALLTPWRRPGLWLSLLRATKAPVQAQSAVQPIATRRHSPRLRSGRSMAIREPASLWRLSLRVARSTAVRSAEGLPSPTSVLLV